METRCGWGWEWRGEGILGKGSSGKDTKEEHGGSEHGKGQPTELLTLVTASWLLGPVR